MTLHSSIFVVQIMMAAACGMPVWTDEVSFHTSWQMQLCLVIDSVIYVRHYILQ